MKQPLLSIVGPTATGKTNLALKIANFFLKEKQFVGIDLISADSRQIYKGLEITSGADIPKGFTSQGKYWGNSKNTIRLHGVSFLDPNQSWSLAQFQTFAQNIFHLSWKENRLPIVVGGTGLYHQHLLNPPSKIRPNTVLRKKAATKTIPELQAWLKKVHSPSFAKMNHSDQHNPRRIIRALEKALEKSDQLISETKQPLSAQYRTLGLKISLADLRERIQKRVKQRFEEGSSEEVQTLFEKWPDMSSHVRTTLGVPEIRQFLAKNLSVQECLDLWSLHEFQYAKRQITWWKKRENILWLEEPTLSQEVQKLLIAWRNEA